MPEVLKVQGSNSRASLVEYLVEKRVRALEYFRLLHTKEDVLWMNTIRLGKTEIGEYFGVDRSVLDPTASRSTAAARSRVVIRHLRTESTGSASMTGSVTGRSPPASHTDSDALDALTHLSSVPLRAVEGLPTTVSSQWLEEYLPKFFALGATLSELLLVPMSGPDFVDAVYQVFLEFDVHFASGSAARVLAGRTLKNHRWARAQKILGSAADIVDDDKSATGSSALFQATESAGLDTDRKAGMPKGCIVSSKPHFLSAALVRYGGAALSYDLVVPSLCTTIIFVYRRMCDFDAVEDPATVQQILQVDRRFKRLFIGVLSKELHKLATLRTVQQAYVLSDHIFGAFSHADDSLVSELLRSRGTASQDSPERGKAAGSGSTTSVTGMQATHQDPVCKLLSQERNGDSDDDYEFL